jgi:hypothetical protein
MDIFFLQTFDKGELFWENDCTLYKYTAVLLVERKLIEGKPLDRCLRRWPTSRVVSRAPSSEVEEMSQALYLSWVNEKLAVGKGKEAGD